VRRMNDDNRKNPSQTQDDQMEDTDIDQGSAGGQASRGQTSTDVENSDLNMDQEVEDDTV